jgi:hypothetical protein
MQARRSPVISSLREDSSDAEHTHPLSGIDVESVSPTSAQSATASAERGIVEDGASSPLTRSRPA